MKRGWRVQLFNADLKSGRVSKLLASLAIVFVLFGSYSGWRVWNEIGQTTDVYRPVFDPVDICEASFERQAPYQRQLTTFKIGALTSTAARTLSFGASSGRLTLPSRNTAPDALSLLL